MSQEQIDFGAFPNDPTADAIRVAFEKVQNNFSELYLTSVSTGVVTVTAAAGLDQNRINGNIVMVANIANVTIQTGNSLIVGIGTATTNAATISRGSTPFVIDVADTVTTNNFVGNTLTGTIQTAEQTNITTLGTLVGANSTGNIKAPYFIGNLVGNLVGNVKSPGSNTQLLFNRSGIIGASPNFRLAGSQLTLVGDADLGNSVTANYFIGTLVGSTGDANFALLAGNIQGGDTGSIVYQTATDITGFTTAGASGQVLKSGGRAGPGWVDGTISGVSLGNSLNSLIFGNYFTPSGSSYDGSSEISISLDATSAPTLNTLVLRDGNGAISALNFIGDGLGLTNIPASSIVGLSGDANNANYANFANFAEIANFANFAGNVTVAAQPNITSLGTLSTTGLTSLGNITAPYFIGNLIGNVANSGIANTANFANYAGNVTVAAQPNITSLGTLSTTGLTSLGNITAPYFIGNLIGDFTGNIKGLGNTTEIPFNKDGVLIASNLLTFDNTSNTFTANLIAGNGNSISRIWGPNVADWVPKAVIAQNLANGKGGAVPYQGQPNVTLFVEPGTLNDAFLSTGTGAPKWIKGSISNVFLGNMLYDLVHGNYMLKANSYNGSESITMGVDATVPATANKIVARDAAGNINAVGIGANILKLNGTTAATNTTSGALIVAGGVGVAGNIFANGNITANTITATGNFIGNFIGNLTVTGTNTGVLFNDSGIGATDANLVYDKTQGTITALRFSGSGAGLTSLNGANVISEVANAGYANTANVANFVTVANRAKNVDGGVAGAVMVQTSANVTGFSAAGSSGQALISGGAGVPTWANGTISSVKLGNDLFGLANGTYLTGGTYNGNSAITFAVDAATGATANKIVARDNTGKIFSVDAQLGNAVTANYFIGNLVGNIVGNLLLPGATTQVVFNNGGVACASSKFTFVDATGTLTATIFSGDHSGNGAALANLAAANVKGIVANAAFADTANAVAGSKVSGTVANATYALTTGASLSATNINGGAAGGIPYQTGPNLTGMVAPGTAGQVMKSGGTGAPTWGAGTISGVLLGNNLFSLSNGGGLLGGAFNGGAVATWSVDATPAATANKIVSRDASINFSANMITANLTGNITGSIIGGVKGAVVWQTDANVTGFTAAGTTNDVLMTNSAGAVIWGKVSAGGFSGGGFPNLTAGYGLAGGYYNGTGPITFTVDATPSKIANTVVKRDANSSIYMNVAYAVGLNAGGPTIAGTITGNWTLSAGSKMQATYADLAEYYSADGFIEPGTVVDFGGEQEVTISTIHMSNKVAGVISSEPAYVMNSNLKSEFPVMVALQGRVPVKVVGTIKKGDMMVSAGNGHATACSEPKIGTIIGKSLENFDGAHGIIEVAIGRI